MCSAVSAEIMQQATRDIIGLLRERHHLHQAEPEDFNIRTPEELIHQYAPDVPPVQRTGNLEDVFLHPHDLTIDREGSLSVAQYASDQTYPIKLERV